MPFRAMQATLLKTCCEAGLLTGSVLTAFSYLPIVMGTLASTAAFCYYSYTLYKEYKRNKN